MNAPVQSFIDFIRRSPSAFHAVESACEMLRAHGFTKLDEHKPFAVAPGGKYYVTRNRSSVIALTVPERIALLTEMDLRDSAMVRVVIAACLTIFPPKQYSRYYEKN